MSNVSPASVLKERSASDDLSFSVSSRSMSIRISVRNVRNGVAREASKNRTFPPESRIASMDIFRAGPAGPAPPAGGKGGGAQIFFFFFLCGDTNKYTHTM